MGSALVDHRLALLVVCVASLLAGIPLAINMFWHLQVRRVRTDVQGAYARKICPVPEASTPLEQDTYHCSYLEFGAMSK